MIRRGNLSWGRGALFAGALFQISTLGLAQEQPVLTVAWGDGASSQIIQTFSAVELSAVRQNSLREPLPGESKTSLWKGASLSALVDQAMAQIGPEKRAQVDVVILYGKGGHRSLLPRALAVKYPLVVATSRDGLPLKGEDAPTALILPWTTRSSIKGEGAPLESLFVRGLERIELANYRQVYGGLFLRRRTDPSAMRGEKLFVQNCLNCHASGQGPGVDEIARHARAERLSEKGHPAVRGAPELTSRDRRALRSYLDAFLGERGADSVGQTQASAR